jgi:isochorismate synthase
MVNNFETYLNEIVQVYKTNMPFVVFKKPNELKLTSFIPNTNELIELNSFEDEGFVFTPFNAGKKVIFPLAKSNFKKIDFKVDEVVISEFKNNSIQKNKNEQISKERHVKLVQKAINFIEEGKADKIVLSRKETISDDGFHLFNSYKKMLLKYPNAFVYIWFHPKIGLWMGATPEKLLSIEGDQLKTMALAGTQIYKNTTSVKWKQKEIEEQQFVSDFIVHNLQPFVKSIKISNSFTVKAGNLLHICTTISAVINIKNSLKLLISALHPTPAVCGLPKHIATNFILENENYNRNYYTGFLGELNIKNKTELYVNLRCMQLENNSIHIYVGGGITKDSNALNEWKETKNKAMVIENIL